MSGIDRAELAEQVKRRREVRTEVLLTLYALSGGKAGPRFRVPRDQLHTAVGQSQDVADAVLALEQGELVATNGGGAIISLTAVGVEEAEELLLPTDEEGMAIINAVEVRRIEAFSTELDRAIDTGQVQGDAETLEEIRELLQTLQSQLGRKPRRRIMKSVIGVIGDLLTNVGGSAAYELARRIPDLFT